MSKSPKKIIIVAFILIGMAVILSIITSIEFSVADKNIENATFFLIQKSNIIIDLLMANAFILLAIFFNKK